MSYDFSTLNDKDLEELVRDILSVKLETDFQSFKSGKDKGIDLRYASNNNENEIIVQVKHFLDSGLTKLKSILKKQEVEKVIKLNPQRYIFVTSLALSPQSKAEIKIIFNPYIKSTSDILGKNDLNNFLRNNPAVVENHFKLWLSGTAVLKRILHNGVKGRSDFTKKHIYDKIRIFVPSITHKLAVDILNQNNFILITGAPGIGKTTLANMLTYQLLAEDFELVYVREIREAEDSYLPNKKQVFYFDDFLGASTLDLKSSRNADSAIVNFTDQIRSDKSKRLILTCRTTLLKQAKEESEKIDNSKMEVSNYEVKIENYRNLDKAKILYHHIYFSNLSEELKAVFFKDKFYWKVITHRNYNPRIIEFFTDIERLQPEIEYSQEVLDFLEDPTKIWEKSYNKQISNEARFFLSTLYSLGGRYIVEESNLKEAFDIRLEYEVSNNNYTKTSGTFNKVVKELLDGFINRVHKTEKNYTTIQYRFLNPSIEDFLYNYFNKNIEEYFIILKSAIVIGQFRDRITTKLEQDSKRIYFGERNNYEKLLKTFSERLPQLKGAGTYKNLHVAAVLIKLFKWVDIKHKVIQIMNNLSAISLGWDDRYNLIEILDYIADNNIENEFNFSIENMLLILSEDISYYYHIEAFSKLISSQERYKSIITEAKINNLDFYSKIQNNINKSWSSSFEYYIEQTYNLKNIIKRDELIQLIETRKRAAAKMNEFLNIESSPAINEYSFNYDDQLQMNLSLQSTQETLLKSIENSYDVANETLTINRLFNIEDTKINDDLPFLEF
ncbi:nSTAND3 domain-containing NTPase [Albibacterium bauzanense]|uniref:Restriction endonuclease n=1 Tax=Albibacterium bauzanense TaxID=653929 RepID=A0A4R1LVV6_9SPHI|nr:restriction endonuclease [Albibacterium bauzanense]TCK82907.1 restriction endonuclease [Albibacterium bauzanense]